MVRVSSPGPSLPNRYVRGEKKQNPHGEHDEFGFAPEHDFPVRCFECSRLMDPSFLAAEKRCPNCNKEFSLKECRDIAVEAQVVNENMTGWNRTILDRLADKSGTDRPVHVDKDLEPVTGHKRDTKLGVAREMTAWANQAKREIASPARAISRERAHQIRAQKAREALVQQLRQQSSVSRILGSDPV